MRVNLFDSKHGKKCTNVMRGERRAEAVATYREHIQLYAEPRAEVLPVMPLSRDPQVIMY